MGALREGPRHQEFVYHLGFPGLPWASLVAQSVKNLPAMQETRVGFLGWEDPLEKEMATHSSIIAWRIPWTEKPGRFPVHGVARVEHDLVTEHPPPRSAFPPHLLVDIIKAVGKESRQERLFSPACLCPGSALISPA